MKDEAECYSEKETAEPASCLKAIYGKATSIGSRAAESKQTAQNKRTGT